MSVTLSRVHDIFKSLVAGNGSEFFAHVAENVDWAVQGTHPLASNYRSKADFLSHAFRETGEGSTTGYAASGSTRIGKRRLGRSGTVLLRKRSKRSQV
jgi:ketosteroid isomerase-like protein